MTNLYLETIKDSKLVITDKFAPNIVEKINTKITSKDEAGRQNGRNKGDIFDCCLICCKES